MACLDESMRQWFLNESLISHDGMPRLECPLESLIHMIFIYMTHNGMTHSHEGMSWEMRDASIWWHSPLEWVPRSHAFMGLIHMMAPLYRMSPTFACLHVNESHERRSRPHVKWGTHLHDDICSSFTWMRDPFTWWHVMSSGEFLTYIRMSHTYGWVIHMDESCVLQ